MEDLSDDEHDLLMESSIFLGTAEENLVAMRELISRWAATASALRLEPGECVQLPRPRGVAGMADASPLRTLVRLGSTWIEIAWRDGRSDDAIDGLADMFACVDAAMRDNGGIVGLLTAAVATDLALARARWLMDRHDIDEEQLARIDRALAQGEDVSLDGLRHGLAAEYQCVFRVVVERLPETRDIDSLLRWVAAMGLETPREEGRERVFGESPRELLDVDATYELCGRPLAEYIRSIGDGWTPDGWTRGPGSYAARLRAELGITGVRLLEHDGGALPADVVASVRQDLANVSNPIGKLLAAMMAAPVDGLSWTAFKTTTTRRALRVYGALRVLQLRGEGLPESLEALVRDGGIDRRVSPTDPLSGRLFGYDRERRMFWSVGRDGVDDGGIGDETNVGGSRDLVWVLPEID
jgi:hypothetical protein